MLVQQVRWDDAQAVEQVPDPLVGIVGGAAYDTDHVVAFVEQQFGEVGAVLPRDSGDERSLAGLPVLRRRCRFPPLFAPPSVARHRGSSSGAHCRSGPELLREWMRFVANDRRRISTCATAT